MLEYQRPPPLPLHGDAKYRLSHYVLDCKLLLLFLPLLNKVTSTTELNLVKIGVLI